MRIGSSSCSSTTSGRIVRNAGSQLILTRSASHRRSIFVPSICNRPPGSSSQDAPVRSRLPALLDWSKRRFRHRSASSTFQEPVYKCEKSSCVFLIGIVSEPRHHNNLTIGQRVTQPLLDLGRNNRAGTADHE